MNEEGQSLFEVVVSIAVSALIIVALVTLVTNSIRNANFSKNNSLAANFAQEATEWLRGQRDGDIVTFMTNTLIPDWCLKTLSWSQSGECSSTDVIQGTEFIREAFFNRTSENGKTLVESGVTVSWEDSQGLHEASSITTFSDWRER